MTASGMGAGRFLPEDPRDLDALRAASAGCQGCGLFERATQTVFGAGDAAGRLMLVGEQPGDKEDLQGASILRAADEASRQAERERFVEDLRQVARRLAG